MKRTQRTAILITAAATWLALAATAATASPPSVQGTAGAAKRCITVTATIPVGTQPSGVAANPKTNTIYVPNSFDSTVSVINGRTNTVTTTIPVGSTAIPAGAAANPKTNTIYVANFDSNTVSVISGRTNTVTATVPVTGPGEWRSTRRPTPSTWAMLNRARCR